MPRHASPVSHDIKLGFDTRTIELDISQIMPLKVIAPKVKEHAKYKQIRASIQEVGIIEPPVVAPSKNKVNGYVLLDGHLRLEVLKELGIAQVVCLVSPIYKGLGRQLIRGGWFRIPPPLYDIQPLYKLVGP